MAYNNLNEFRSAWQWARRGFRPIAGTRSFKRGSINQPLFGSHQVAFVGVDKAVFLYHEWQARNNYRPARNPNIIQVNGRYYREI